MKNDKFYRNIFISFATIVAIIVIYKVRMLLSPVFSALIVAYITYPVIVAAGRFGIPKWVTILFIFITFVGLLIYIGSTIIPSIKYEVKVLANLDPEEYKDETRSKLLILGKDIVRHLKRFGIEWDDRELIQQTSGWIAEQSTYIVRSIGGIAAETGQFLMIFFFVLIFALLDGEKIYKSMLGMIPNSFFEPGVFILKKTIDLLGYYLRGLVIENTILGAISFLLLLFLSFFTKLSVILAIVIAFIIALTNVIRIVGPIIGAVIGILLVLLTTADFLVMAGILATVAIVQLLDNTLILPLVMKEQVEIHPVFCVLGVLTGGILGGILGMIIAIPAIGSLKVIYRILAVEMKKFNMDPEPIVEMPRQLT